MGKIYIIGEDKQCYFLKNTENVLFLYPSINEDKNDFVVKNFQGLNKSDVVIFDFENGNWEVECEVALHIRLTPEIPEGRFVPFVFSSNSSLLTYIGKERSSEHSTIFLTKGYSFVSPQDVEYELPYQQPITLDDYYEGFLKRIRIRPEGDADGHSIANEWGAKALARMLPSNMTEYVKKTFEKKESKLYFKYRMALSGFSNTTDIYKYQNLKEPIDIGDKKVLIIDDEADKGWSSVLEMMIKSSIKIEVFNQKAKSYNQLPQNIRKNIESENNSAVYDLIFLDLRMNGVEEEDIYNPKEFSGMKILKEIKNKNEGIQVIIFTASNKAWNLEALLEAGADGYYIKESPEYGFSIKFSEANSKALCDTIKRCVARSYLKEIYISIQKIEKDFNKNVKGKTDKDYKNFLKEILSQIKLAFEMENLTDPTDLSVSGKRKFANAYITLYQVIEQINKKLIVQDGNGRWRLGDINGTYATGMKNDLTGHYSLKDKDRNWKYPEWMKIMSLFNDYWKQNNNAFLIIIQELINKRSAFVHDNKKELNTLHSDIYEPIAFKILFESIMTLCSFL